MKKLIYLAFLSTILNACVPSGVNPSLAPINTSVNLTSIAIGSCCNQSLNMSIFNTIKAKNPDLYIAVGDNMYADNYFGVEPGKYIQEQYDKLNANASFKNLRMAVPCIATWDDHDYGANNAGVEYANKLISKEKFLNFWNEPSTSERRTRDGIYTSYYFGDAAHKVQIIILDCRNFLNVISGEPITPTTDTNKTILGAAQWAWLKQELMQTAKIRIIVSSSQFAIEKNGWESWANYPHEQQKMHQTIKDANAEGVFFVSGDVHYSEFSKKTLSNQYPIYDFTSSGLTHFEPVSRANQFRIGTSYNQLSFGMINIDWNSTPISINLDMCAYNGNIVRQQVVSLDELKF
jgi:alkaline phosphatase D